MGCGVGNWNPFTIMTVVAAAAYICPRIFAFDAQNNIRADLPIEAALHATKETRSEIVPGKRDGAGRKRCTAGGKLY